MMIFGMAVFAVSYFYLGHLALTSGQANIIPILFHGQGFSVEQARAAALSLINVNITLQAEMIAYNDFLFF